MNQDGELSFLCFMNGFLQISDWEFVIRNLEITEANLIPNSIKPHKPHLPTLSLYFQKLLLLLFRIRQARRIYC